MKIAMVTRRSVPFGERVRIEGIAAVLRAAGHRVDILPMDYRAALRSPLTLIGFMPVQVWRLLRRFGFPAALPVIRLWIDCIMSAHALIPALRGKGAQILLTETHHAGLCGWLMRPYLAISHYMDFHGTADEVVAHPAFFKHALAVERALARECEAVVVCSVTMRDHLIKRHGGDPARYLVCHNGSEIRDRLARHGLPLRVIYAGVFAYYQRIMDYIDAARFNDDPEIEFYLMGGGGNETEVLRYIEKHSVRIKWLGYRERAETLDLLATMQVGVLPSTTDLARRVASPIKVLDYASCGLPVVTVAVGEWSQVFDDYRAGVVCARCDPESILAGIRSLKDEERWTAASRNAVRVIRERRNWPATMAPLVEHLAALEGRERPAMAVNG